MGSEMCIRDSVKADGLAAGKGVLICQTKEEAKIAIESVLSGQFGKAGNRVVVEQHLSGEEVSVFALVHGTQVLWLASAQDHKQVGEGDIGPNTGGMGAYSPTGAIEDILAEKIQTKISK